MGFLTPYIKLINIWIVVLFLTFHMSDALPMSDVTCPMKGFSSCDCRFTEDHHISAINCTNQNFQSDQWLSTLSTVAPQIRSLIFTGNNIKELRQNLFGNCSGHGGHPKLNNLTFIDLSNNSINIINGKTFHCVPSVKKLALNQNVWNADSNNTRVFSSMPQLEELHLITAFYHNNSDHMIHIAKIFKESSLIKLKELHLEFNSLSFVHPLTFCGLPSLRKLYLTGNDLNKIQMDCLEHLHELYLDNNGIPYLMQPDMANIVNMSNLAILDITRNPFQCTECTSATKNFRDWLKSPYSNMVVDKDKLYCVSPQKLNKTLLTEITAHDLEGTCDFTDELGEHSTHATTIVLGIIFAIIGAVTIVVIYLNRVSIKKQLSRFIRPLSESTIAKRFQYQYSTMDESDMDSVAVQT